MKSESIEVDSIHLGAYLLAKKIPVIGISRSGRMGVFSFCAEKAGPEINKYMAGKGQIEPRSFANAIRELKRMVDEVIVNGK